MNPAGQTPSQPESISLYMASGESETLVNVASISFEWGNMVFRDHDGHSLKTVSAGALAFASRSPDVSGLNVWI